MQSFNVINFDFNAQKFKAYDVIPYFIEAYSERTKKYNEVELEASKCKSEKEFEQYEAMLQYWKVPKTFDEFKSFVKKESQHQFWSRCEYEIVLIDWPCGKVDEKWDIYDQIMMNLDIVARIVMESVQK